MVTMWQRNYITQKFHILHLDVVPNLYKFHPKNTKGFTFEECSNFFLKEYNNFEGNKLKD